MREMSRPGTGVLMAVAVVCAVGVPAHAAMIEPGRYLLGNGSFADGDRAGSPYGLRLDELRDVTPGNDVFAFDFEHPQSSMWMDLAVDTSSPPPAGSPGLSSIHIFGTAFGGRRVSGTFVTEPSTGVYSIDFTYAIGVGPLPAAAGLQVIASTASNAGFISPPTGGGTTAFPLWDLSNGAFNFQLSALPSPPSAPLSQTLLGTGGLNYAALIDRSGGSSGDDDDDHDSDLGFSGWRFTATSVPGPTPLSIALLTTGLFAVRRRR